MVVRYIGKMFSHHISPTIGASFFTCKINIDETRVKLQVGFFNAYETFNVILSKKSIKEKFFNLLVLSVLLQVWDTAGQERFRSMAPMYYRNANAALLVFDITQYHTFTAIKNWVKGM